MKFGIGIAAVLAVLALIVGGAFWAAKHPEDDKTDDHPDDKADPDLM